MRRGLSVPRCAPDVFQLYTRNDPKQVPRRNVHIISRPDASKGADYDFIRAAPFLAPFSIFCPRARFSSRSDEPFPFPTGNLEAMTRFSLSLSLFLFYLTVVFCYSSLFIRTILLFSLCLSLIAVLHDPQAKSHGRITRNPTTLWPVDGSTELLLARAFSRLMALWIQIRRVFTYNFFTILLLHFITSFL